MTIGVWEETGAIEKPEVTPLGLDMTEAWGIRVETPQFGFGALVGGGQGREPGGGIEVGGDEVSLGHWVAVG